MSQTRAAIVSRFITFKYQYGEESVSRYIWQMLKTLHCSDYIFGPGSALLATTAFVQTRFQYCFFCKKLRYTYDVDAIPTLQLYCDDCIGTYNKLRQVNKQSHKGKYIEVLGILELLPEAEQLEIWNLIERYGK
jgi:hypothetical protein